MKKKSPRQAEFSFLSDLPPEEFILRIPRQAKEYAAKKGELLYREILREDENKEVWLGLERGGHAGYWYCSVVEKDRGRVLDSRQNRLRSRRIYERRAQRMARMDRIYSGF